VHTHSTIIKLLRRVWRYQRGNQASYIKEEQTKQCPKEKVQTDKEKRDKASWQILKKDYQLMVHVP
jgi:hypothetical protein